MKPWEKSEQRGREKFAGGRRQPGSGNMSGAPGDTRFLERITFSYDNLVLMESKYTEKKSLSIQQAWLRKIDHEAALLGRLPMLSFDIDGERWIAIPERDIVPERDESCS